jgi:hypothetical protein
MVTTLPTLVRVVTLRLLVLATGLLVLGCSTPYAKLDGVLAGPRPAPSSGPPRVTLVHEGATQVGAPQQSVVKGDSLLTAADGVALLTLRAGYEVIVEPGTELSIENPSIFVKVGRLIVKSIRRTREALRLNTRFVSAAVEGTVFVFEVTPPDVVRLSVLEGSVFVSPRSDGWAGVTYRAGEVVTFRGGAPPSPVQQLGPAPAQAVRRRIVEVEQAAQYRTGEPWSRFKPLWQKPIFYVPAAVAVVGGIVIVATRGGSAQGTVTIQFPLCPAGC